MLDLGIYGRDPATERTAIFGNGDASRSADEEGGSGASTPPLWRPDSPESLRRNYSTPSPRSRTEAIARGQTELMEMVRNLPEAYYELSLKDLVEVSRIGHQQERLLEGQGQGGNNRARRPGSVARTQLQHRNNHQMVRSGSLDGGSGGLLLKMMFPVPWGTRKKKKKKIGGSDANSATNGVETNGASEKEWWRPRALRSASARGSESAEELTTSLSSGSRKSSNGSRSSSSNSWCSSSSSNSRRHEGDIDCWPFIRMNKSRSLK